jgi:hypothetical protein
VVPDSSQAAQRKLEDAGAGVVPLPFPVTPAARVVMAALPITGCVVSSPEEVDWLHDERGGPGWDADVVSWCVGGAAAARARERGWRNIRELSAGLDCSELISNMVASRR